MSHISTWSKATDPEKTQADMRTAKAEADAARYDLARKLVEIEGQKRHVFIDAMVGHACCQPGIVCVASLCVTWWRPARKHAVGSG